MTILIEKKGVIAMKYDTQVFVQQDKKFEKKLLRFQKYAYLWGVLAVIAHAVLKDRSSGELRAAMLERWSGRFFAFAEDIAQSAASQLEQTRISFEQKMADYSNVKAPDTRECTDRRDMSDIKAIRAERQRRKDKKKLQHELIALHDEIFYIISSCDRLVSARQGEVLSGCVAFAEGACRKDEELLWPAVEVEYDMWDLTFRAEASKMKSLMKRYDETVGEESDLLLRV